ncbi:MAG TPA: pyridoxamine 5'-phosphate oxidase [Rhodospirillales bacterium]|nr:pyridoxamine 5'-phosphate oxidase [Rhodospirillales bacterium]
MSFSADQDPITLFKEWFAEAERSEPINPDAMTLATATPSGAPSVRMILLKRVDQRGFAFYTNLGSRKADELRANPRAALCFYWKSLGRQVRVEGSVESVDDAEADAYFATRPRLNQIGAWASKQSQPLKGRFDLEKRVAKLTAKFNAGEIPRPDFWSGFNVIPENIEFWWEHAFRLHDRVIYYRENDGWKMERLYP